MSAALFKFVTLEPLRSAKRMESSKLCRLATFTSDVLRWAHNGTCLMALRRCCKTALDQADKTLHLKLQIKTCRLRFPLSSQRFTQCF